MKRALRAVWSEFGKVLLHRTSLIHCAVGGSRPTGKVLSEFVAERFEYNEPPRITSNNCDEGGCRHTGKVQVRSERFEYNEPPRITVKKREAGLQGRFE